jgi:hypothetical protein
MFSARSTCAALSTTVALATATVAEAATVTPPAGTPDLAAMALQPSDLAPGAAAGQQGYVTPETGFTAQYDGDFTTASTPDGVSYFSINDFVSIAQTASTVAAFVATEQNFFRSKDGHKVLDQAIIRAAGKSAHLKAKNIRYAAAGSISIADESFLETIGVATRRSSAHEDVVMLAQGRVYALLIMAGNPGEKIPASDASSLASAIDSHINDALAPSGSTGSSGSSG